LLNVLDEFTRACLTIRIGRNLNSIHVIDVLIDLFLLHGIPGHIRLWAAPASLCATLGRPPRIWRSRPSCTNIQPGPLHGGRSCQELRKSRAFATRQMTIVFD
jgi:hypothetical protein